MAEVATMTELSEPLRLGIMASKIDFDAVKIQRQRTKKATKFFPRRFEFLFAFLFFSKLSLKIFYLNTF